ncbi:Oidioi.mRNA.OKI2018_I69.PAR.g10896.t1.cds [Oikopleura dioica]|uniref:Oidioi.mRNA.OKI2018_I69.PAR.g10896.t1.cds n=1 Tax=Oikopleura dioica TaxID=34765 RepID=A0ABN7RY18_OIKDI|nr:Oidioi.mRNA.OKI2018_I69.PAR.g10896.t1.cds [Oikopleura dioica]
MVPPEGYQIRVFSIALCYIVATMASFQAFTMIAPGAALGTRCSTRTFFAILLSFFCLKEKILKLEIFSVVFCTIGLIFYAGDSMTRNMDVNNGSSLPQNVITGLGFGLCAVAGLSRSIGMTMYRKIKVEIDPVTIVLVHSVMTVIAVIPIMLEFESFSLPKTSSGWVYLVGACCSATIATFCSNWSLQYINPGLASVAQNTDIIVSVTLEHLVIKTLPSGLEIAAVIFVLLGTTSLPLFRYWESLKKEREDEDEDAKALLK